MSTTCLYTCIFESGFNCDLFDLETHNFARARTDWHKVAQLQSGSWTYDSEPDVDQRNGAKTALMRLMPVVADT